MGHATEHEADDGPAPLHAVVRDAVGDGLRSRRKLEKEIPHELMVLLMQMAENQRRSKKAS